MAIPGKRRKNGKYLEAFEDKEDAIEYIKDLARRYKYTPGQYRNEMSIRRLAEEAKEDGVKINRDSLAKWFRDLDIEIHTARGKRERTKEVASFTISKPILEQLDEYQNKSEIAEIGLRLVLRETCEAVLLFMPEDEDEEPVSVIFSKHKDRIRAQATGELKQRDRQQIRALINRAEKHGLGVVVDFAETFNYKYFGGN